MFNLSAALSLLLLHGAVAGWATSYARPSGWRLIATAHSDDLTRSNSEPGSALFTTTPGWSKSPNHGFWDAWWARSESGRLTLLTQVIDYEGTLSRVYATPPSLTVDPPGRAHSRTWLLPLPYWLIVLVALPIPVLWLRARRHRSRSTMDTTVNGT